MRSLNDPTLSRIATSHGINYYELTPREKANFIAVMEYNQDRQRALDADPEVVRLTGLAADNPTMMLALDAARDAAARGIKTVEDRERELVQHHKIPIDPARLQENHTDRSLEVIYDGQVHLKITHQELTADKDGARKRIADKIAELNGEANE